MRLLILGFGRQATNCKHHLQDNKTLSCSAQKRQQSTPLCRHHQVCRDGKYREKKAKTEEAPCPKPGLLWQPRASKQRDADCQYPHYLHNGALQEKVEVSVPFGAW